MIVKRSLTIRGHRTSISIEDAFWHELKSIAARKGLTLPGLVALIDEARGSSGNLSSALRLFVLDHVLARAGAQNSSGGATPGSPS